MKGALIGSTCSGKTTGLAYLIYNLGNLRTKVGIGNEVAIDCPYPLGESGEFLTQWWIVTHQIEREHRLMSWFPNVIMDRSVLDSIVYSFVGKESGRVTEKDFFQIYDTAISWMKHSPYDFFVYLSPLDITTLQQRPKAFQLKIDSAFKLMLAFPDINKIPIYTITEQDKDKRNKEIYDTIKEVMKL